MYASKHLCTVANPPSRPSVRFPHLPGPRACCHLHARLSQLGVRLPRLPDLHAHLSHLGVHLPCLLGRHAHCHPRSHLSHLGVRLPRLLGRHARLGPLHTGLLRPPSHLLIKVTIFLVQRLTLIPSSALLSIQSIQMLWHSSIFFVQPR